MTKPKPNSLKAKRGRKTKREKAQQIRMLKMLAQTDDLTAWQASLYAGCGYDFALSHFQYPRYLLRMDMARKDNWKRDPNGLPIDYSHRINEIQYSSRAQSGPNL